MCLHNDLQCQWLSSVDVPFIIPLQPQPDWLAELDPSRNSSNGITIEFDDDVKSGKFVLVSHGKEWTGAETAWEGECRDD